MNVNLPSHAFDNIPIPPFHVKRRPRQTYHATKSSFGPLCVHHKWQDPVLRGFADSVETDSNGVPEIEAEELKMWQEGEDPVIVFESVYRIVYTYVLWLISSAGRYIGSSIAN